MVSGFYRLLSLARSVVMRRRDRDASLGAFLDRAREMLQQIHFSLICETVVCGWFVVKMPSPGCGEKTVHGRMESARVLTGVFVGAFFDSG